MHTTARAWLVALVSLVGARRGVADDARGGVRLTGVILDARDASAAAALVHCEQDARVDQFVRIGDQVCGTLTLRAVDRDGIRLTRAGDRNDLRVTLAAPDGTAFATEVAAVVLERADLERALTQWPLLVANVRWTAPDADGARGLTVMQVPAGSVLSQLGLRQGDRVDAIDGTPFTTLLQAPAALAAMRERGRATMTIRRGQVPMTIEVVAR